MDSFYSIAGYPENSIVVITIRMLATYAKEIITIDTYTDSQELIIDGVPELQAFNDEVLPSPEEEVRFQQELLETVVDTTEYIHE